MKCFRCDLCGKIYDESHIQIKISTDDGSLSNNIIGDLCDECGEMIKKAFAKKAYDNNLKLSQIFSELEK